MKQFSLKVLLLIIAIIGGLCAWWTYDPFGDAVQAIVSHGGAVSYDYRRVGVSFAPWMASMPETPHVIWHYSSVKTADDLSGIYDDVRYLALQRPFLRVEFSREEHAQAMHEHFERFPIEGYRVSYGARSPHSFHFGLSREKP